VVSADIRQAAARRHQVSNGPQPGLQNRSLSHGLPSSPAWTGTHRITRMSPCKAQPVLLLVGLGVDDFQQLLAVHTVNSAGLLHCLTAAAGAAQAMHT